MTSGRLPDGSRIGETDAQRSRQLQAVEKWCSLFGYVAIHLPTCSPLDALAVDENQRIAAVIECKSRECRSDTWPDVPLEVGKHRRLMMAALAFGVNATTCRPTFIWSWTDRIGYVDCYAIANLRTTRKQMNGQLIDVFEVPTVGPDMRFVDEKEGA